MNRYLPKGIVPVMLSILTLLFLSCKKSTDPESETRNVFVVGYEKEGNVKIAKYWMNETSINLSDGKLDAAAFAIVSGENTVFIAGYLGTTAGYWKDHTFVPLSTGKNGAVANAIYYTGGDIFAAGNVDSSAVYWKNGISVSLPHVSTRSDVRAMAVVNGDVYCAGADGDSAVYWKNGKRFVLPSKLYPAAVKAVAVQNGEVYYAGSAGKWGVGWQHDSCMYYWYGSVNSLYSDGLNIFSCGVNAQEETYYSNGICYKNGANLFTGDFASTMTGLFVLGSDVYCCGTIPNNGTPVARYWKNGNVTHLTDGKKAAAANAVFVVKK